MARQAARSFEFGRMTVGIPIGGPLPDVTRHVVEAVAIRWKRSNRGTTSEPVETLVVVGKRALPHIGHIAARWHEIAAPAEIRSLQLAPSGELPPRLGWERLA